MTTKEHKDLARGVMHACWERVEVVEDPSRAHVLYASDVGVAQVERRLHDLVVAWVTGYVPVSFYRLRGQVAHARILPRWKEHMEALFPDGEVRVECSWNAPLEWDGKPCVVRTRVDLEVNTGNRLILCELKTSERGWDVREAERQCMHYAAFHHFPPPDGDELPPVELYAIKVIEGTMDYAEVWSGPVRPNPQLAQNLLGSLMQTWHIAAEATLGSMIRWIDGEVPGAPTLHYLFRHISRCGDCIMPSYSEIVSRLSIDGMYYRDKGQWREAWVERMKTFTVRRVGNE